MKTFGEFLEEAKRIRFLNVYRGDSKEVAKGIQKTKMLDLPSMVFMVQVYMQVAIKM
jgi:hypothetical protein